MSYLNEPLGVRYENTDLDMTVALQELLRAQRDEKKAQFHFLEVLSTGVLKGQTGLIWTYLKADQERSKFFVRQVQRYLELQLRRGLFSFDRTTTKQAVEALQNAVEFAARDLRVLEEVQISGLVTLGNALLGRQLDVLDKATEFVERVSLASQGRGTVHSVLEAYDNGWPKDRR